MIMAPQSLERLRSHGEITYPEANFVCLILRINLEQSTAPRLLGTTWHHMAPHGSTWLDMASHGSTWLHNPIILLTPQSHGEISNKTW